MSGVNADSQRRALPNGIWGAALFVATEATLFASLIATYFYLRFNSAQWPPPGVPDPKLALPLVLTGVLVASTVPVFLGSRAARAGNAGLAWLCFLAALVIQGGYLGVQLHEFLGDLDKFSPHGSAYASIYFTLLGIHHAHVAVGMLIELWLVGQAGGRAHELPPGGRAGGGALLVLRQPGGHRRGVHPGVSGAVRTRRSVELLMWAGILGAPAMWACQHAFGIGVSDASCSVGSRGVSVPIDTWTAIATALAGALAVAALAASVLTFRATRGADSDSAPPEGRIYFLSICGMVISPLFLVIILMSGIATEILPSCHQG